MYYYKNGSNQNNTWTCIGTIFTRRRCVHNRLVFGGRPRGKRGGLQSTMCHTLRKTMIGKKVKFLRYCKNLRYDSFFVYSYDTAVIQLNWRHRTAKRLGSWSKTTSTHMNYAIRMLTICYAFKEIQN